MKQPVSPAASAPSLLTPVFLLALSLALLAGALSVEGVRQRSSLLEQHRRVEDQGRTAENTRLHYFALFRDLVALSATDGDAARIVRAYGIEFTEPPASVDPGATVEPPPAF